jgi:hypothetical protein
MAESPIPARASHLYQVLDLCVVGIMKKEDNELRNPGRQSPFADKLTRKIERVLRAWHRACFRGTWLAASVCAGFVHEVTDGLITGIRMNPTLLVRKIEQ